MKKPSVYACMPTHATAVDMKSHTALRAPSQTNDYHIKGVIKSRSLLAANFNGFWCNALNDRYDYFLMLHADISPQPGWLDILMSEMKATGADVVSVVVPLKDEHGLTSTAIGEPGNNWNPRRRLTMTEVHALPETFDIAQAGYPDDVLLVNTGCFLVDLSKPWCRAAKDDGTAEFFFTINDRITFNASGQAKEDVEPEDWYASRQWARLGAKVVATRKVAVNHRGTFDFTNAYAWGDLQEDLVLIDEPEMVKQGCPYKTRDGKEVIHLHLPKNGGTSLWQVIGKPPEVDYRTTHATVEEWRRIMGDERYEDAISFAVCRNPYDRVYSAWSYLAGDIPISTTWPGLKANKQWVIHSSGPDCTFEHFLMNATNIQHHEHFIPQTKWLGEGGDDVKHLLRFESLAEEWAEFCALVGLDVEPLPHRNASEHGPWEDAYTPEMIERANELYAQDFDALPYEMLSPEQFAGSPALTA